MYLARGQVILGKLSPHSSFFLSFVTCRPKSHISALTQEGGAFKIRALWHRVLQSSAGFWGIIGFVSRSEPVEWGWYSVHPTSSSNAT